MQRSKAQAAKIRDDKDLQPFISRMGLKLLVELLKTNLLLFKNPRIIETSILLNR
jgi:hypothetical protein